MALDNPIFAAPENARWTALVESGTLRALSGMGTQPHCGQRHVARHSVRAVVCPEPAWAAAPDGQPAAPCHPLREPCPHGPAHLANDDYAGFPGQLPQRRTAPVHDHTHAKGEQQQQPYEPLQVRPPPHGVSLPTRRTCTAARWFQQVLYRRRFEVLFLNSSYTRSTLPRIRLSSTDRFSEGTPKKSSIFTLSTVSRRV